MQTHKTIYKRTSSGKVQVWYVEIDGDKFRTISGQQDGKKTTSAWTVAKPKNVGKVNATTGEQQAIAEVQAMYTKKLEREYRESIDAIDVKTYTKPMLADKWKDRKSKIALETTIFLQPKLDGMRAIASKDGLFSRDGKRIPGAQHIEKALVDVFAKQPDLKLDGELYNHEYKDKFESLISALKNVPETQAEYDLAESVVQFHVYDIASHPGVYSSRRETLSDLFETDLKDPCFQKVPTYGLIMDETGECIEWLVGQFIEDGYEGAMVRLDGVPYENKRSKSLLKVKDFLDEEFEIAGIEEGKGNWAGYAKVVWIILPHRKPNIGDMVMNLETREIGKWNGVDQNVVSVSKSTVKGNRAYCKDLLEKKDEVIGKLGTVTFFRYTNDGVPYLPVFKGVRWDV